MENQQTMTEWFLSETGGHRPSARSAIKRVGQEYDEALIEVHRQDYVDTQAIANELADIVISATVAASMCGVDDLQQYIDAKMAVNRSREWTVGPDFCIQHVKSPVGTA